MLKFYPLAVLALPALMPAQQAPQPASVDDMLRQARQEILNFQKDGGQNSDPGHPAEKWARELWKWRDKSPGTPDAARATTEAVRLLVYADSFTQAQAFRRMTRHGKAWRACCWTRLRGRKTTRTFSLSSNPC
jgi:hypothetical protein